VLENTRSSATVGCDRAHSWPIGSSTACGPRHIGSQRPDDAHVVGNACTRDADAVTFQASPNTQSATDGHSLCDALS
jgi:hypothetical protein